MAARLIFGASVSTIDEKLNIRISLEKHSYRHRQLKTQSASEGVEGLRAVKEAIEEVAQEASIANRRE